MKSRFLTLFLGISVAVSMLACSLLEGIWKSVESAIPTPEPITPVDVTRQFIEYLNAKKPDNALDLVCASMALPNLAEDTFREVAYEEVSNNDIFAEVRVTGEIRLQVKFLGALKKEMDFLMLLDRSGESWCINNDSLSNFFLSLFNFKE